MIKYIGSKRVLVPRILEIVQGLPRIQTAIDLFSGTARVSHALKSLGIQVTANDHNVYAYTLARCYVQADRKRILRDAQRLLLELSDLPQKPGYFTETFCQSSRYFQPKNGAKIDAIRERINELDLEPDLEAVLLVSLMEAADRVDSTCGLQMAYLKGWAARSYNDLELRMPDLLDGSGVALHADAYEAALSGEYDLAYLDPPYNQHKYLGNYHIWETLVRWDRPEVYGIACKRMDCKTYDSPFNSSKRIHDALKRIVARLHARFLLVSFNNEGFVNKSEMEAILGCYGEVTTLEMDFKRYVGAQIGIYNPQGVKVGKVSHLHNKEYLYLVSKEKIGPISRTDTPQVSREGQLQLFS